MLLAIPLFIGLLQFWALKKYIGIESTWVWASLLTYGVFWIVIVFLTPEIGSIWFMLLEIATFGGLGIFQKKILDFYTYHTGYWLVVSPASAVVATQMYLILAGSIFPRSETAFWILFSLVYGISTGIALIAMDESGVSDTPTWST